MGAEPPASRSPQPAWMLAANIGPSVLAALHQAWPLAPLLYCAGNAVWITQLVRRGPAGERDRERLALAWVPCLLMSLGALSLAWLSQPANTINGGLVWDGRYYYAIYSY